MEVRGSDVLAWVQVQRKMSQVLDAFGLLGFTRSHLARFLKLMNCFFNFPVVLSHGKPHVLNQRILGTTVFNTNILALIGSTFRKISRLVPIISFSTPTQPHTFKSQILEIHKLST
jgi:hypothetical protein